MNTTLARRGGPPPPVALPLAGNTDAIGTAMAELKSIRTFVQAELRPGVDFGVIPGTGTKPTLLLPGAQKTAMYFNCRPAFELQRVELDGGHLEVLATCRLVSRGSEKVVGEGFGSCSTMEKKYRVRTASRACPECGKAAIIKGREEYGGGWLCHKKQGGCGAKYRDGDPAIESQAVGTVDNPDVWDARNTVLKMAIKRAQVAAALNLGCLAELFTQDLEDVYDLSPAPAAWPEGAGPPAPAPAPAAPAGRAKAELGQWVTGLAEQANTDWLARWTGAGGEVDPRHTPLVDRKALALHLAAWAKAHGHASGADAWARGRDAITEEGRGHVARLWEEAEARLAPPAEAGDDGDPDVDYPDEPGMEG